MKNMFGKLACKFGATAALAMVSNAASAATTGNEFTALADKLVGWIEGGLGVTIAVVAFIFGLGASVAKANAMPAVFGIVVAIFATMGPGIIKSMFTALI